MRHLVVSLSYNQIRLTCLDKNSFNSLTGVMPEDLSLVSKSIKDMLVQLGINHKGTDLTFVVEPNSVFLRFITIPKHTEELDALIISEIKSKYPEFNFEESYFAYEKIAPFVYQFIGVNKDYLESLIKISDELAIPLVAVIPWVAALPKYVNTKEAAIFIAGNHGEETITLSELGGVFFCNTYSTNNKSFDLEKTVKELSVYRKDKPIKNIYSLNYSIPELSDTYNVQKIEFNMGESIDVDGYETNLLAHFILDQDMDLDDHRINLLNLLPLPSIQKQPLSLVKVGSMAGTSVVIVLLLLLVTGVIGGHKGNDSKQLADAGRDSNVLSTQDPSPTPTPIPTEEPKKPDLKRENLKVRVENGSGINGMAAKTKTMLEGKGYKVVSIDTANATTDATILSFTKTSADFQELVKQDLGDSYGTVKANSDLSTGKDYDLLLIIGSGTKQ